MVGLWVEESLAWQPGDEQAQLLAPPFKSRLALGVVLPCFLISLLAVTKGLPAQTSHLQAQN